MTTLVSQAATGVRVFRRAGFLGSTTTTGGAPSSESILLSRSLSSSLAKQTEVCGRSEGVGDNVEEPPPAAVRRRVGVENGMVEPLTHISQTAVCFTKDDSGVTTQKDLSLPARPEVWD